MRKLFEIGGVIAGLVMITFGVAAIYMGVDGRTTVRDSLKQEQIVFGSADDPAVAKHASQWVDKQVTTGTQARAFAQIMREHALEGSGGLAYAQMGRFVSAKDPRARPAPVTRRQRSRMRREARFRTPLVIPG